MSWLLTFLGWYCIASATFGAGVAIKRAGQAAILATDLLFGLVGIGVLFLLLARMLA